MSSTSRRRGRRKGLFMTWAGDSPWKRLVAWLGQTAPLIALFAAGAAIIWFVLTPWMIESFTDTFRNTLR
jgi:hypothetical protein